MSEAGGILGPGGPDLLVRMRGRAVGAIVCAGFGAYALYWWVQAAISGEHWPWFGAIAAVTAVLVAWAIANLASLRHEPRVVLDKRLMRNYRIKYALIVAIESAAIPVGDTDPGPHSSAGIIWAMDRRGSRHSLLPSRQTFQATSLLLDGRGDFAGCFWVAVDFCEHS